MRFERCAQACSGSQFLSVGKPSPRVMGKQNRICQKRFFVTPRSVSLLRMIRGNSAPAWFEYVNRMLLPVRMIGQKWTSCFSRLQWALKVVQQQA
jgi:hypothetical protein